MPLTDDASNSNLQVCTGSPIKSHALELQLIRSYTGRITINNAALRMLFFSPNYIFLVQK